jgi:UDP-glucose 4-epimerase
LAGAKRPRCSVPRRDDAFPRRETTLTSKQDLAGAFAGKRALITGGMGFIGSTLAIRLVELGAEVTVADAMIAEYGGNPFNLEPVKGRVRVNFCDVRDEHLMAMMVEGQHYVFHLAAQVSHVKSLTDPYPDIDINIKGTASLMEAVRKRNPTAIVVRSGTRGEYGPSAKMPVSEDAPTQPKGLYEISLLTSEKILLMYHDVHKIPAVHLRVTNTYGPRAQMKTSHYGVANWLIRLALDGQPITVMGDGLYKRDFLYVDDCVEAMLRCAVTPACHGQTMNVGRDTPSTFRELAETIARAVPGAKIVHTEFSPERKAQEPGDFYSDISKIARLTGWKPATSLEDGVRATVDYYQRHRAHYW